MVCSVMTAALACVTLVLELKEHRYRRRLELLTRGLKTNTGRITSCVILQLEERRRPVRESYVPDETVPVETVTISFTPRI